MEFKTIKEFNEAYETFEKEFGREKWRVPWCPPYKQKWPHYRETSTFQFCAETFRLWNEYKKGNKIKVKKNNKYGVLPKR